MRTALVLGASGLVGGHCLEQLLADPFYGRVVSLGRRTLPLDHPRLEQRVADFDRLADAADAFRALDVFCCLGTTIRRAGSQEAFRRVDHDYPVEAARLASRQGAERFLVVSALGADARSRLFYNRVKGEMEEAVRRVPIAAVWVLRPSLLLGEREERRPGERVATALSRPLAPLLVGPLRRWRPIPARDVARAMLRLARGDGRGGVVENEEIARLAAA